MLPFLQGLYAAEQHIQVLSAEGTLPLKAGTVIRLKGKGCYTNIYPAGHRLPRGYCLVPA